MDIALIKELRERTGVGFGDCKKALVEADWDMDRAVDIVRLQSGAKAAKKADRTAAEGLLGLKIDGSHAAMVEVNVETDFAARNPKFAAFVERAVTKALEDGADGLAATLEAERQSLVQEIGENINVRRATRLNAEPGGTVVGYLHLDGKEGHGCCHRWQRRRTGPRPGHRDAHHGNATPCRFARRRACGHRCQGKGDLRRAGRR